MDLQTKILEGADGEDYWIVVARGALTEGTLREMLQKLAAIASTSTARKFLVDLQYTTIIRRGELSVDEVIAGLDDFPLRCCRIIFVCPMGTGHYGSLQELSVHLSGRGVRTAVFTDPKRAADWLSL